MSVRLPDIGILPPRESITELPDSPLETITSVKIFPTLPITSESPKMICSGCGLTEEELNETGLFGCPRCYETFARQIAIAIEELHGVRVPTTFYQSPPRRTITMPWPTQRSIRL